MRLILDTHALIWAVDDPTKVGVQAVAAMQDPQNELLLSAGSIWEISIKVGLAKLALSLSFREWMQRSMILGLPSCQSRLNVRTFKDDCLLIMAIPSIG